MNKSIIAALCLISVGGFSYLAFGFGQQSVTVDSQASIPTASLTGEESNNHNTNNEARLLALPAELRAEINQLRTELNESKQEQDAMREELTALQDQLSNIENNLEYETLTTNEQSLSQENNTLLPTATQTTRTNNNTFGFNRLSDEDRTASLRAAGVDDQTIASITERSDQFALARLELIDRATREGDRGSEEFHEELEELEESRVNIRDEIGDDAYDQYLINAGRDNRVVINSIINGSAASIAGIQTGDLIYSYAGSRIFTNAELQRATREGSRGEYIEVEVISSDGGQQFYSIERGPMGVTLGSVLNVDAQ